MKSSHATIFAHTHARKWECINANAISTLLLESLTPTRTMPIVMSIRLSPPQSLSPGKTPNKLNSTRFSSTNFQHNAFLHGDSAPITSLSDMLFPCSTFCDDHFRKFVALFLTCYW